MPSRRMYDRARPAFWSHAATARTVPPICRYRSMAWRPTVPNPCTEAVVESGARDRRLSASLRM